MNQSNSLFKNSQKPVYLFGASFREKMWLLKAILSTLTYLFKGTKM